MACALGKIYGCWPVPEVHPEGFYPEYTEGLEGGHRKRFRARLEGPADVISRSVAILVACAFETFCGLVTSDSPQNPQAPRDILQVG